MRSIFRKAGLCKKPVFKRFTPQEGECYENRNGQTYRCIRVTGSDTAVMENVSSGWQFTAHRLIMWSDGYIEWGCSTSGRFVKHG